MRAFENDVLMNFFRARYADNDDGRIVCLMRNLEYAVMEGQEARVRLVACALGINTDGNLVRFHKVCRRVDCLYCVAGIFAVDGNETAFADHSAKEGNFEIFGLGYKR